jgi:hypothetical protein
MGILQQRVRFFYASKSTKPTSDAHSPSSAWNLQGVRHNTVPDLIKHCVKRFGRKILLQLMTCQRNFRNAKLFQYCNSIEVPVNSSDLRTSVGREIDCCKPKRGCSSSNQKFLAFLRLQISEQSQLSRGGRVRNRSNLFLAQIRLDGQNITNSRLGGFRIDSRDSSSYATPE